MAKIRHLETKFSIASYDLIKACEPLELRFYLWLKLWAINKHEAFPSYKTICADLGMARTTFSNLIKRMEGSGRLRIERKSGRNSLYDITWYDSMLIGNLGKNWGKPVGKLDQGSPETGLVGSSVSGLEPVTSRTNRNITIITAEKLNFSKRRNDLLGKLSFPK